MNSINSVGLCHDVQGEPAAYYEMKVVLGALLFDAPAADLHSQC